MHSSWRYCYLPVSGPSIWPYVAVVRLLADATAGRGAYAAAGHPTSSQVCASYQAPAELEKLRGSWKAFDIVADDDPERDSRTSTTFSPDAWMDSYRSPATCWTGARSAISSPMPAAWYQAPMASLDIFGNFTARNGPILVSSSPSARATAATLNERRSALRPNGRSAFRRD
jgi:hypothetical protein